MVRARVALIMVVSLCLAALSPAIPVLAEGEGESTTHVVARGEMLSLIARRYGVTVEALARANGIANPDLIHVGQVLTIPAMPPGSESLPASPEPGETAQEAGPAPDPPAPEHGTPLVYLVQRGDSLSRIAARHNVSLRDLLAANDIPNPNVIHAGLRLTIPAPGSAPPPPPAREAVSGVPEPTSATGKQVIVVLSQQRVYAFEDGALLEEFLVSTGLPRWATPQGEFSIYWKVEKQRMRGPDYDLPNVKWVSYFYGAYSFHGTYWHSNFGQPMSHGCINMRDEDAEWLYHWAPIGTPVLVVE